MLNLAKPFGALICTVQIAVVTGVLAATGNFVHGFIVSMILALILFGVALGAMQFFDRILVLSDRGKALWISFTPLVAIALLWGAYRLTSGIARQIDMLQQLDGAASTSLISTFGGNSLLFSILAQIALLAAAYVVIFPLVQADRTRVWWFALPIIGSVIGWLVGWFFASELLGFANIGWWITSPDFFGVTS